MQKKKIHLSKESINQCLIEKEAENLNQVKKAALSDPQLLREILLGIQSKPETYRYNCYKVIFQISKDSPQLLYGHWNYFLELLKSGNAYHRMAAVNLIAHISGADAENKFDLIFHDFFQFLDDKSMIVARYLAMSAGIIAQNKPNLTYKIIEKLLEIENTHHTEGRKDLIKHDIIQSFGQMLEKGQVRSAEKEKILSFAEKQLHCSSPKTRQIVKEFLEKWKK